MSNFLGELKAILSDALGSNRKPLTADELLMPLLALANGEAKVTEALITKGGRLQTHILIGEMSEWLMTFGHDDDTSDLVITHAQAPDYRRTQKDERFSVSLLCDEHPAEYGRAVAALDIAWEQSEAWYSGQPGVSR